MAELEMGSVTYVLLLWNSCPVLAAKWLDRDGVQPSGPTIALLRRSMQVCKYHRNKQAEMVQQKRTRQTKKAVDKRELTDT